MALPDFTTRESMAGMSAGKFRHSMCRACWNKHWPKKSSVGHEVPANFPNLGRLLLLLGQAQRWHHDFEKAK
jgi:hypothetical protein